MTEPETMDVSVIHCDLRQASHPLAVGHYIGDVIVNAEAALDSAIGGALRSRFDLGIYPGDVGTSEVVLTGIHPPGAIVVGLGPVGELTPERLRLVFAHALRRYAVSVLENGSGSGPLSAGFSTVLVGTDGGAFGGIDDSIHAVVRAALDANRSLAENKLATRVRIDRIEFIELYEDIAIRAAHTVGRLPGPIAQELEKSETITGARRLDTRAGGRFLRPSDQYASGWWQRIAVRKKTNGGASAAASPDSSTALQFTVLTDRARLEQEVAVGQRALIQQLLATATGKPENDVELSAALYQLVVPPQVKDRLSRGGDLLFMVDRAGAVYPYELMAERTSEGPRPLASSRGILRQFETEQYRVLPEMARANQIFIVGNPKTILWDDLPGALSEADEVEKVARTHDLEIVRAPREDGERTIVQLMTRECRILHFAAHGQFDPDPMKSGVVVGDRLFITPAEVAQLTLVPELVFLNCCYLGTMGEARAATPDPRLAASLAEGFIQAGVRAVIAAGWAVADEAGLTFARTFYASFLGGATFGDAVKTARDATRRGHPEVNTWGAYQCYGNPDYRFRRGGRTAAADAGTRYVARSEALQALRTLASSARSMRFADKEWLAGRFDRLQREISKSKDDKEQPDWTGDGEVLSACADVCGELEDFDRAIDFYRGAVKLVPARLPLAALEQLANLLSRSAMTLAVEKRDFPAATGRLEEALSLLDWLDQGSLPKTKERWAIRGGLHKRWAVCDPGTRSFHIKKAGEAYAAAADLAGNEGYQRLNALALKFVRGSASARKRLRSKVDSYVEDARLSALKQDRTFWDIVETPDAVLHRHLVHGTLVPGTVVQEIIEGYKQACAAGPSMREWASVRDHVAFLAAMAADQTLDCCNAQAAAALGEVLSALDTRFEV